MKFSWFTSWNWASTLSRSNTCSTVASPNTGSLCSHGASAARKPLWKALKFHQTIRHFCRYCVETRAGWSIRTSWCRSRIPYGFSHMEASWFNKTRPQPTVEWKQCTQDSSDWMDDSSQGSCPRFDDKNLQVEADTWNARLFCTTTSGRFLESRSTTGFAQTLHSRGQEVSWPSCKVTTGKGISAEQGFSALSILCYTLYVIAK